ncbi:olfactory receptor 5P68-like [Gastrophryne carolinensis]
MDHCNHTKITEFILVGIEGPSSLRYLLFMMFSIVYIFAIAGNLLIIALIIGSSKLHTPMYFFLCHLSTLDIILSTNVVPHLLHTLLGTGQTIVVGACLTQYTIASISTISECGLLTVMSYDRYLAICVPLRYVTIMSVKVRIHLVLWSWSLGFLLSLSSVFPFLDTGFCGCNIIDDIYCDHAPLLKASCSDTTITEIQTVAFSIPIVLLPFIFIIVTYVRILHAILKISTSTKRRKAFSTCTSHLIVVTTYYGTLIAKYTTPASGASVTINKLISLLYIMFTPLLNPAVYSLRNREIQVAMRKWMRAALQ